MKITSREFCLFAADAIVLLAVYFFTLLIFKLTKSSIQLFLYFQLLPYFIIFPALNYISGLYTPTPLPIHQETSILCKNVTIFFMVTILIIYFRQKGIFISRGILAVSWFLSLFFLPLGRYACRFHFRKRSWWSSKAILFGSKTDSDHLEKHINAQFDPVIMPLVRFDACCIEEPDFFESTQKRYAASCAVVVVDEYTTQTALAKITQRFRHVILMPSETLSGTTPSLGTAVSFGTAFGFKLAQNLLDPKRQLFKRGMDVLLSLLGLIVLSPFFIIVALCIFIEDPGNPFYSQRRIGKNGVPFNCLKFRSMVRNADSMLESLLEKNPSLADEWEKKQKLAYDPRILRLGHFLRRSSIDELPQLINVLKGEMSFVGPRPILENQITKYGSAFDLYTRVRPGITGLWQVSGRADTSFLDRVRLDRYYVYNWSVMLDILIFFKTIPAVLMRKGAV